MKRNYLFDPKLKHHLIISVILAIWIFVFLFFTEPLDVNEFGQQEKLLYLPGYGILAAFLYGFHLPIQYLIYNSNKKEWRVSSEIIFSFCFISISIFALRYFYLIVIMDWHPNAYSFNYHLRTIIIPAILTVFPIIIIARFAFGKYHEKRLENSKVEIKGEGNYEGLRLNFNDIISIKSSDNYIEVFYLSSNVLKKTLIRNKLSVIDAEFEELLRTHRSYLINPFHFQQWKTENSKLSMRMNYDVEVPISKTYQKAIKKAFQLTTN